MWMNEYAWSGLAIFALSVLYIVQIIVGDLAQDAAGHTPGKAFDGAHDQFAFRAVRAPANSLENMPFMIVLTALGVAFAASPLLTNALALAAAGCRLIHMLAYYADRRYVRGYSWMAGVLVMLLMIGNVGWAAATGLDWLSLVSL